MHNQIILTIKPHDLRVQIVPMLSTNATECTHSTSHLIKPSRLIHPLLRQTNHLSSPPAPPASRSVTTLEAPSDAPLPFHAHTNRPKTPRGRTQLLLLCVVGLASLGVWMCDVIFLDLYESQRMSYRIAFSSPDTTFFFTFLFRLVTH